MAVEPSSQRVSSLVPHVNVIDFLTLFRMTRMRAGHEELERFMKAQIAERKSELQGYTSGAKAPRDDVFSLMIHANEAAAVEDGIDKRVTLDDQELV